MGMFDYIKCEMPLPETPEPPPDDDLFQTKDTPEQYLAIYTITADGRLTMRPDNWVEMPENIDGFEGDINFYKIGLRQGQWDGREWEYHARFTNGRCASIGLVRYSPLDPVRVDQIKEPTNER